VFDTEIDPNLHTDYAFQLCSVEVKPMQEHMPIAKGGAYPTLRTVGDSIEFYDDGSFDPDGGLITKYEWDWENDGVYDAEGKDVYHAYSTPGNYEVQLRVTDDEGQTDTLDQPLQIRVKTGPGWARTWPAVTGWDAATDPSGNVYVVGYWSGAEMDFDPGPGVDMHSEPGYFTCYLSKYDSTGIFQWARTWGASGDMYADVEAVSVAVDPGGSVFVCGYWHYTTDFDPGPGEDIHDSIGGTFDAYVSKFTSDGAFQWVRTRGGEGNDAAYNVAADLEGNVYIGGDFTDTIDLDPGLGTDMHPCNGGTDAFLLKLDGDGNFGWGRTWGSDFEHFLNTTDSLYGISADCPGHVFVVGQFEGTCDFDPGPGEDIHQAHGLYDAYLSAFDPSGEFLWCRTWGTGRGLSTAATSSGDVYISGDFAGTVDFDPGPGVSERTSAGDWDAFVSKFSSEGDFVWAGTWGSDTGTWEDAYDIAIDEYGNAFVTGRYRGTTDFDPGPGVEEHSSIQFGGYDVYLSKFSPQCEFQWVRVWGGDGQTFDGDYAYGVACGPSGVAYVTGQFDGTCDFDPGPGVDEHANPEWAPLQTFLTKFGPDGDW
jgi:hypothetical protein